MFLLRTDKNGNQWTTSGFPENMPLNMGHTELVSWDAGNIETRTNIPYNENNIEHPDNSNTNNPYSNNDVTFKTILEGDTSNLWDSINNASLDMDGKFPYELMRQNSNTTITHVLTEAGIEFPKLPDGSVAPGSGNILDKDLELSALERLNDMKDIAIKLVKDYLIDKRDNINMRLLDKLGGLLGLYGDEFTNFIMLREPLILDLNGNGKIDVTAEGSGVYFDFNKDGMASSTGWVGSGDGLLVLDKNLDGVINDGSELFGDDFVMGNGKTAKSGFEALASLDSNNDGMINVLDPMYHLLKVWKDTNGDGISQADELFTLSQLGIAGLSTGYIDTNETLEGGNILAQIGSYVKNDGSIGVMGDVFFVQDFTQIRPSISA